MPNPRAGTVVGADEVGKAVHNAQAGRVEFRLDRLALMHMPVGKASFEDQQLIENIAALVHENRQSQAQRDQGRLYPWHPPDLYHGAQREDGVAEHAYEHGGVALRRPTPKTAGGRPRRLRRNRPAQVRIR